MTVQEKILIYFTELINGKLQRLKKINAPAAIIEGYEKMMLTLQTGNFPWRIKNLKKFGDEEVKSWERKQGRQPYYLINNSIYFFPAAKYNPFLKEKEK